MSSTRSGLTLPSVPFWPMEKIQDRHISTNTSGSSPSAWINANSTDVSSRTVRRRISSGQLSLFVEGDSLDGIAEGPAANGRDGSRVVPLQPRFRSQLQ